MARPRGDAPTLLTLNEEFLTVTELRQTLTTLDRRFARREEREGGLVVDIVTDHGKPVGVVMPFHAYKRVRELLLLVRAQADVAAGRAISFGAGTSAEQILDSVLGPSPRNPEPR